MLRPASKIPPRDRAARKSVYEADLREFERTGQDVAIVEVNGRKSDAVASTLRDYIKRHKLDGKYGCVHRQGRAYLYRKGSPADPDLDLA